jgi:3-oxoadipate enol-lactonase
MLFYNSSGYFIYYEVINSNSKQTPLILLNGLSQSTLAWSLCTPYFKNRPVILMDFIFQGQSQKDVEHYRNFNQHASDVVELIEHLKYNKVHVAGISYGSLVAQHLAINYPNKVEKLILISSFAHKTPFYEAIEQAWHNALETGGYALMLDVMLPFVLSENYFNNPLIPIEAMKQARTEINSNPKALKKLMQATKERGDFRNELKKIKSPALVIHGEYDLLFPVHMGKEVASHIPNAQFLVIKKAGHTLNLEAPTELANLIKTFIE